MPCGRRGPLPSGGGLTVSGNASGAGDGAGRCEPPLTVPLVGDQALVGEPARRTPGSYTITETQPATYPQGTDSVGTAGGSLAATDQFFVQLGAGVNRLDYNYGEQPPGGAVHSGQAAGIGFWNNKNGQALIKALPVVTNADGSVTSVANWLAAPCPTSSAQTPAATT